MKKACIFLALLMVLVCNMCACDYMAETLPTAYPETRWVSENPYMWFEVESEGEGSYHRRGYGCIDLYKNGDAINIMVGFELGGHMNIYVEQDDGTYLLKFCAASEDLSPDGFVARVYEEKDLLFDGRYSKIVFSRKDE